MSQHRNPDNEPIHSGSRLKALYSTAVHPREGVSPEVSIRLLKEQKVIRFRSDGPILVRFGAQQENSIVLPPHGEYRIEAQARIGGANVYWVLAERFAGHDLKRIEAARARWEGLGHSVSISISGRHTSIGGESFDSRKASVLLSPSGTRKAARKEAARLKKKYNFIGQVVAMPRTHAGGLIALRGVSSQGFLSFMADDLVSLRPYFAEDTIELYDVQWPSKKKGSRWFSGTLYALYHRSDGLLVVNRLKAEEAVQGVVTSELYPDAPVEALKAQAVLARGQLLAHLGHRHPGEPYNLCGEHHCQAFHGQGKVTDKNRQAVLDTVGMVLMNRSKLVPAAYHSVCGGHTESYNLMWRRKVKSVMRGVPDGSKKVHLNSDASAHAYILQPPTQSWCKASASRSGLFRWTRRRSSAQVTRAVAHHRDIGVVTEIKPMKRGVSGRVLSARYSGSKGEVVIQGATENRRVLGGLPSGLWTAERQPEDDNEQSGGWLIRGGGYGHGVGLCQHGSMGMARAGHDFRSILSHYYRGSRIGVLWTEP